MIHSLLEDVVRNDGGPAQLAAVRAIMSEQHGGKDPFTKVQAFASALGQSRKMTTKDVYRFLCAGIASPVIRAFPALMRSSRTASSLLSHINKFAPAVLDALLPGVTCPEFDVELLGQANVRLRFVSSEEAAAAIEGAIVGIAAHFNEAAECSWSASASTLPDRRVLDVLIKAPRISLSPSGKGAG